MDGMLKEWQKIFQRENEKAQNALRSIWHDIDVEYRKSFNLPATLGDFSNGLDIAEVEDNQSFLEQAYNFAGQLLESVSKAKRFMDFIGNFSVGAIAGAVGFFADLFGAFFGDRRETWRDKVRSEVIRAYSGYGDLMAETMKPLYNEKAQTTCQNLKEAVNARIYDMERQLQDILREKEVREQDAEK